MSSFLDASSALDVAWTVYVVVGTLALFVWGVRVLRRLADRHGDDDRRAGTKATLGILAGLGLGILAVATVAYFEQQATEGIHDSFVDGPAGISVTLGEADYQSAVALVPKKQEALATQRANLERANDTYEGDPSAANKADRDARWLAVNTTAKELRTAQVTAKVLEPHHLIWLKVQPLLESGRDDEARAILDRTLSASTITQELPADKACRRNAAGDCATNPPEPVALAHSFKDSHQQEVPYAVGMPAAFETKEEFEHQMSAQLRYLVYPGLTGVFLAPLVLAGGSILRAGFVPSDSVGFKPYPSKAAATFLLLGAFGVFAIPYGAWVLRDLRDRSKEGQIAL